MVPGIEDSPDPLLQFRMFLYRDAQYHRLSINLHQVPGKSAPSLRAYAMDLKLTPRSQLPIHGVFIFVPKLRRPTSFGRTPRHEPSIRAQQLDNTVSRKSHFYHEAKPSEYEQARALYSRVMDDKARRHLHSNTACLLKMVEYPEIQVKYLAQLHGIAAEYAKGVYDLLPEKKFDFKEVEARARGGERVAKEPKFAPSVPTDKLAGLMPSAPVYNV